jgi:hypothetical protein
MDTGTQLPRPAGPRDMTAAHWGSRMRKWRKWAEEMRSYGWTVEEPAGPPTQGK